MMNHLRSKFTHHYQRGNIFFFLGAGILGYVGFELGNDWYQAREKRLSPEEEAKVKRFRDELRQKYLKTLEEEANIRRKLIADNQNKKYLKRARVLVSVPLDGPMTLRDVEAEKIVEILEENVGPGGLYHLCRVATHTSSNGPLLNDDTSSDNESNAKEIQVGWYPIQCLEIVEEPSLWKKLFRKKMS